VKEIILYTAAGSNCSQRVEWVLNYKQIPYAKIDVGESERWKQYLHINPMGYVPCLSLSGVIIPESMAIIESLEEGYPTPTILGSNWQQRAEVRAMCEFVNGSLHMPQNRTILSLLRPDLDESAKQPLRADFLSRQLTTLSPRLFKQSQFAIGKQFTLADIFIASIYKKALQHGMAKQAPYHSHLRYLRKITAVADAEPN
jgi:glutathione S-transferase